VTAVADQLGGVRRREFRRLLVLSAAAHVGGALLFTLAPTSRVTFAHPEVIAVDLVASAARVPAARPAPAPVPAPAPAPPPAPVKKKVVLPKEPELPKPVAKPETPPQRRELAPPESVEPAPQRDYADVMKALREQADEGAPDAGQASEEPAPAAVPPAGGGRGAAISPEVAAWMRKAKIHVRRAWVVPPGFRTQPLETHVMVKLDAVGTVVGEPRIVRRSGNPWYDEGVVRAIQKASPLPPPPEADEWAFVFVPEDSF
jgi:protein TonB